MTGSLTSSLTRAKWTLDQYHRMIEAGILDDCRVELLQGEIVEMSPEGEPHAFYSTNARDYLIRLLSGRALVRDGKPVTLPVVKSEPEPDLAVVQPLGKEYLNHHPYPENIFWVIEFSNSSLKKDLDPKAKVYAAAGIPEPTFRPLSVTLRYLTLKALLNKGYNACSSKELENCN